MYYYIIYNIYNIIYITLLYYNIILILYIIILSVVVDSNPTQANFL